MPFDVEVIADLGGLKHFTKELVRKQLPFATAVALTRTAQEARDVARKHMAQRFTLRSTWPARGLQIQRAEKKDWPNVRAIVGHKDELFVLHETGGIKKSRQGRRIAIPTKAVRRTKTGKISRAQRPARALQRKRVFLAEDTIRQRTTKKTRRSILYLLRQRVRIRPTFGFRENVERTAGRVYAREFDKALTKAVKTAKERARGRPRSIR